jgi:hypothetical protein
MRNIEQIEEEINRASEPDFEPCMTLKLCLLCIVKFVAN